MDNKFLLLTIFVLYLVILIIGSLWPFNFDFDRNNNARWMKNTNGIEFRKKGQVITKGQADYLFSKLTKGTGLTIEVWVRAYNSFQNGPARIISYSLNPYLRNFTLAQSKNKLIIRLRTTETDLNGINPHLEAPGVFRDLGLQHIVVTYNYKQECIYINGQLRKCEGKIRGNFSNWDSTYQLVIGNEVTGDRAWLGGIFYGAIYSRALTDKEIIKKFNIGRPSELSLKSEAGLVVCYLFNEKVGSTTSNKAQNISSTYLYIPDKLPPKKEKPFQLSKEIISKDLKPLNVIINIIGFLPLGFLLYGVLRTWRYPNLMVALFTLIAGLLVASGIEYLEYFLSGKHSSAIEVFLKTIGSSLGIVFCLEFLKKISK